MVRKIFVAFAALTYGAVAVKEQDVEAFLAETG
jgi:hypothetical protein